MKSPEGPRETEPSLFDVEFYIGKRFFYLTPEQVAQLPDGTAIRPFHTSFRPQVAIIVDPGTRPWLTRPQGYAIYGFLETDQIPGGIRVGSECVRFIERGNIGTEALPPNSPDHF